MAVIGTDSGTHSRHRTANEARRPLSRLAVLGLVLAVLAALAALLPGPVYRAGGWSLGTAFTLLRWAVYGAIGAVLVSIIGAIQARPGGPRRGFLYALLGLFIALAAAAVPLAYYVGARGVPPIHDITTNPADPPRFEAILPLRADAPNPAAYGGEEIAAQQRAAYPDLEPAILPAPPDAAFDRVLAVARAMGWEIVAAEKDAGRVEATATTFWFGFKDDVVIRIQPAAAGSQVDVRSTSRVGVSDLGTNAARVRRFLDELRGQA